ncbi:Molybdate-binding periplasmic protein precursor [Anatilimnocola aggregata]|uniref:Molybdate-binding periplasmic protein n=1 Tax=Anatilimnocola aggregata TaxID=2528021 RepID=A0A517YJ69_9BACT|nr:molybdate ABC transporter substrate-binding protein [Anatilimnocola aggregata]QDU30277.1 Molybdate-binding periplasmic protein precursor [Anatilimnocola aggregata]
MNAPIRKCIEIAGAALCCLITSCGNDSVVPSKAAASLPANEGREVWSAEIVISAAASTKELLESVASDFSGGLKTTVRVNPGPSSSLANQIIEGAPADLFLCASREWAEKVKEADVAERSVELLTNTLVMIVPKGNPAGIKRPIDLLSSQVKRIALAGENVPAGKYADQVLAKLQLLESLAADNKIARAQDVRGALSFVERGEAEAGIVYSTDVNVAPNVEVVHEFDSALHDEIVYVLVLLKRGAKNPEAISFFEYLQSDGADELYAKAGFRRVGQGKE